MSDRKLSDRRNTNPANQESSDLNLAITELHQTIVRLNKVIDRVHPRTKAEAQKNFGRDTEKQALDLTSLKIPRTIH